MISSSVSHSLSLRPAGPFDLANQNRHFGGWPTLSGDPAALVMAFPVEGADRAASVVLRQDADGRVVGEVQSCPSALRQTVSQQALAAISLDFDDSGWTAIGRRDPIIGRLQVRYRFLRPSLFHSPYEAAAAFVIGHRISVRQGRALRRRLASELGTPVGVHGERFDAFPTPQQLLAADALPGISETKAKRLRAIAHAAQDGWLAREALRALPEEEALASLRSLPGIGPFFSHAILRRGAGSIDAMLDDQITRFAVSRAYGLDALPDRETLAQIAEPWRPYRTWAGVLLHVWARTELGPPSRRDARPQAARPRAAA